MANKIEVKCHASNNKQHKGEMRMVKIVSINKAFLAAVKARVPMGDAETLINKINVELGEKGRVFETENDFVLEVKEADYL